MGIKKVFKQIWKLLIAAVFAVVFLFGLLIILDHYGVIDTELHLKGSEGAQQFWGWTLLVSGLIFGVFPFLKIFKWILKMAISTFFLLVFIFGICSAIDWYTSINIEFAHLENSGNWLSIVFILLGLIFGLIPWFKGWKKLFSKFKDDNKQEKKKD